MKPRDVVFGGPGNDHVAGGDGSDKVLGEEGFNTVVDVVCNDGDRDTIFCGWPEEQNYGRVFYSAPTNTQLGITRPPRPVGL